MKTVILSPDIVGPVKNGGIGTFATNLSFLLREHGHNVSIVYTGAMMVPQKQWRDLYATRGIEVIHAHAKLDTGRAVGNYGFLQHSQAAYDVIPKDTDIIYTQDWGGNAFQLLRRRRYQPPKHPIVVSVLHSPSAWLREGMQTFPDDPEAYLALDYAEAYAVRHSDYVVSPSHYMLNWVTDFGWQLPPSQQVLGYPFFAQSFAPTNQPAATFTKIIFFGRLETRKGLELFIDALRYARYQLGYTFEGIQEVVFLGKHEGQHRFQDLDGLLSELQDAVEIKGTVLTHYSTYEAQQYLAQEAAHSLVVMPSRMDNFPFTVIEASLIPNLNLLTSTNGGMGEILGNPDQLFDPFVKPFAQKLIDTLNKNPQANSSSYDWQTANQKWLAFHEGLQASQKQVAPNLNRTVDVCIPHHNHGDYLKQLFVALTEQTDTNFGVIVIDDASTEQASQQIFAELETMYADRGWQFLRNTKNQGLSETRNIAMRQSQADYLIFVDADNIPAPQMVETMRDSLLQSGDDCLTCYAMTFMGDDPPSKTDSGDGYYPYMPLGANVALGMFTNSFGDANAIIKREVLQSLGGFSIEHPTYRYVVGEDHALFAQLIFAGYQLDVIPEFLFYYRYRYDSLVRMTDSYENIMRVQRVYRQQLASLGLEQLSPLTYGLHQRAMELPSSVNYASPDWLARRVPWRNILSAMMLKIKMFIQKRFSVAKN